MMKKTEIKVEKYLDWFPSFRNQIDITNNVFTITLKTNEAIEIECGWDYGYGGSGVERIYIPFDMLKSLMKELEESEKPKEV